MSIEQFDYMGFVKEQMEIVLERAATLAKEEEVQPIAFLIRHNTNVESVEKHPFEIAIMPIQPNMSKDMFASAIAQVVQKLNIVGYIFMSEAWITSDPSAVEKMEHSSLGDLDVEKEEILFASYSGLGGTIMASRKIGEGRVVGPFEINMEEAETEKGLQGRFVNLGFDPDDDMIYN